MSLRTRSTLTVIAITIAFLIGPAACCILGGNAVMFVPDRLAVSEVTGIVTDKYIKRYNDADYLHIAVQKEDGTTEVFQNRDSVWWKKFNSADVQQQIKMGKKYKLTVTGWRIHLLSQFRNIVKFTTVD